MSVKKGNIKFLLPLLGGVTEVDQRTAKLEQPMWMMMMPKKMMMYMIVIMMMSRGRSTTG